MRNSNNERGISMLFQVALIDNKGVVVHAGSVEAASANGAIEKERVFAQLPYSSAEAYDYYADKDDQPLLKKPCHAPFGHFRTVV